MKSIKSYIHDWFAISKDWQHPDNITTKKSKIAYWIFKIHYSMAIGKNMIGKFTNMFPEMLAIIAFIEIYTPVDLNAWSVIGIVVGAMFLSYLFGVVIIKNNFDKIDTQVGSERNMFQLEIHETIVKKRRKV